MGGGKCAWATVYSTTYDFNTWVTTNLTLSNQTTLTVTGDNIATADAANVKVISNISSPAFAFDGRFATDDISNVYLRNGSSVENQHKVNLGIQSKAANKHFSILNLKKGDVVTIVTGSGETSFVSTNATVGGVQVVSGSRVGTNVDGTETGATTVCTMTADGNLDLKLGSWAVIMSVKIEYTDTYRVSSTSTMTDGYTVYSVRGISMTYHGTWTYAYNSRRLGDAASAATDGIASENRPNNIPSSGEYLELNPTEDGILTIYMAWFKSRTYRVVDASNGNMIYNYTPGDNDYSSWKNVGYLKAGKKYYVYKCNDDNNYGYLFGGFCYTTGEYARDSYNICSGEIVKGGSVIDAVAGITMTYGGTIDEDWTYDSGRGPGFHAGANATLTDGIPTAGTFVKFEPTTNGLLTLKWYAFATGADITATLIDADQTIKEVITHPKMSNGNNSYTDDFTTLLRSGVTYYLYLRGSSFNNTFKGFVFTKKTEVEAAIYDCKASDNSAAFATAIDDESFTTPAEVYAFNTTYHITNGTLTDGIRDITGVIRNAAIADGTDWDGANITSGEKYTGAPDNYYLDKNTGSIDASQTIYGLPAGVYVLKAATRANVGTSGNIYVWDGTNNHTTAINANGNTGGGLGNGWDWTEVIFTLNATANVKVGFHADVDGKWASCDDFHLSSMESVIATIGANGYSTFASTYPLDLTISAQEANGFKAYSAKVDGTLVRFTQIDKWVNAGTGVLLEGTKGGSVTIPVTYNGNDISSDNDFLVNETGETFEGDADYTYYGMKKATKAEESIVFAKFTPSSVAIPADKAYLKVSNSGNARLNVVFDDATGISTVETVKAKNDATYNLRGQRVAQPQKGLYIVNGKKVIIK